MASLNKWTPGPWGIRVSKSKIAICIAGGHGPQVAAVRVHETAADNIRATCVANATLIAAAPDLYDALLAMLEAHMDVADAMGLTGPITGRLQNAHRDALAATRKARGEQP